PRIGQMIGPKARSTQGVKIHISATARRGDKSAINTKMQPKRGASFRAVGQRPPNRSTPDKLHLPDRPRRRASGLPDELLEGGVRGLGDAAGRHQSRLPVAALRLVLEQEPDQHVVRGFLRAIAIAWARSCACLASVTPSSLSCGLVW